MQYIVVYRPLMEPYFARFGGNLNDLIKNSAYEKISRRTKIRVGEIIIRRGQLKWNNSKNYFKQQI